MTTATTPVSNERIACRICGAKVHAIATHLREDHPGLTVVGDDGKNYTMKSVEDYERAFPGAPVMSEMLLVKWREKQEAEKKKASTVKKSSVEFTDFVSTKMNLHDVIGIPAVKEVMNASGKPIQVTVLDREQMDDQDVAMIPDIDPNYVFNLDVLRTLILGFERNIPMYLWGHAGTGKTTIYEQVCARTNRPLIRVQHTANMEETHVTGQYVLRDGATIFEEGPLMMAMRRGWVYLADEYDFAQPSVLSVYQPVLELKPLTVKEAPITQRITRPHPSFRIVGTGNTNGTGDETGLYQGTLQQNAANYERFGITEKMPYMAPELETKVVSRQANIAQEDAMRLVDFANRVRAEFGAGKLNNPISPRTLIFAGVVGKARRSMKVGIEKAFINRLAVVDQVAATELAQRVFG